MKIAIIGAGSAGVITTAQLCANLPNGYEIVNVYDPNTKILGIGESTNSGFIKVLEQACHFSFMDDLDELDATLKFGNKFMGWRETDWFNPLLDGGVAIHINNFKLKGFIHKRCAELWPKKFSTLEGKVDNIVNGSTGVELTIDGVAHSYDYIVDTRGFPEDWNDYHVVTSLPVNHALIHTVYEPGNWQYTEHRATANGWQFGIPLNNRRTYGYLYNDTITTKEQALADIAQQFNITPDQVGRAEGVMEYQFKSYYTKRVLDGRIFKNGNRAIFFEPISASSIYFYVYANTLLIEFLRGNLSSHAVNNTFVNYAQQLEDMICFMYHGGSTFDTPFWAMATERTTAHLMRSRHFKRALKDCMSKNQVGLPHYAEGWIFSGYHLQLLDKFFDYNYFTDIEKNKKTIAAIDSRLNTSSRIEL